MTWRHNSYNVTSRRENDLSQTPTATCIVAPLEKRRPQMSHDNVICATSKDSDQPAHTRSLIRAFASRLNFLCVLLCYLEFLSLKGGCTGSSESTLVKMTHCWKSHVSAQIKILMVSNRNFRSRVPAPLKIVWRIILFPYTQSNDNLLKHFCHFS